jgi:Putative zinc-finger
MKQDCLDIGLIQAFMDGELDHSQVDKVSGHIATCDRCASMLSAAEDESAIVFPALEREFNTLVPTQRLWIKINDSIAEERANRPLWQKAWALIRIGMITPPLAAAASVLVIVGVSALMLVDRPAAIVESGPVTASVKTGDTPTPMSVAEMHRSDKVVPVPDHVSTAPATAPYRIERADYRPTVSRSVYAASPRLSPATAADRSNSYMPGEESYVKTIASLSRAVDAQKDNSMRGSERVSFERDMAVVDDAITKMRSEVKRDPKNESAKQVLYSSYQNKIDLLSSVSQKEELVASLR